MFVLSLELLAGAALVSCLFDLLLVYLLLLPQGITDLSQVLLYLGSLLLVYLQVLCMAVHQCSVLVGLMVDLESNSL